MNTQIPENFTPRSFWDRKEGTTGMIVGLALLIALAIGAYALLPFIIVLLKNTITAVLLFVGAAVLFYVLSDKKFWTILWHLYKSAMRAVTSIFVTIDPIGILKNIHSRLMRGLESMQENIARLRGKMKDLKALIDENERRRQEALGMAKEARSRNKSTVFVLNARKAGRLNKSNMTLKDLFTKMEVLYRVLCKMYETSQYMVEDLKDEIDVKSREYAMIKAAYSAYAAAKRIAQGEPDQREIFEMAMEHVTSEFNTKLGEIEHFVWMTRNFTDTMDLENGIYEEEALKMIEEWEKKGDSLVLGQEKDLLLLEAASPDSILDLEAMPEQEKVPVERKKKEEKSYTQFFSDK